ncbi:hypothetical protein BESB_068850 [Besnoitia besnoiti]|uniref:Dihydropteridine reductase n=1 Tax=Besnoitia besnoiti TaxID=94643 RepID=A0A2A9MHG8_BESBE|nr:hypothetical protein BESB_068850 [Besnoitia besnoiti]PFH34852.1 hypothetical protein BESB_068850 [Besnoitia besnoiti]
MAASPASYTHSYFETARDFNRSTHPKPFLRFLLFGTEVSAEIADIVCTLRLLRDLWQFVRAGKVSGRAGDLCRSHVSNSTAVFSSMSAPCRRTVLLFGSTGALGGAVADAFAAARWRVIGCSTSGPSSKQNGGNRYPSKWASPLPPHARIEVQPFPQMSLKEQGEEIARQLQPLLSTGPPLHAAICCSGGFACSSVHSENFLSEAEQMLEANCLPALLCAHAASVLFRSRSATAAREAPLVVLTGAAAAVQGAGGARPTPTMLAYGCSKVYVHHLVQSLAATGVAAEARGGDGLAPQSPSLHYRVVGVLPAILDTAANRAAMPSVAEATRENKWTKCDDIARKLVAWADGAEEAENGALYVVKTTGGATEFLPTCGSERRT